MMNLPPRRRAPRAFTLVELLVVIAIIAVLAGLVAYLLPGVKAKQVRGRVTAEMRALETVINLYKTKTGFYPPDNPNPWLTDSNLLFYELTGTDPEQAATNYLGVTGIVNSGDVRQNFFESLKQTSYGVIAGSPSVTNLLVPYRGTNGSQNFWHYRSSAPEHNSESFDLWAVVEIGGQPVTIGNWKQ